MSLTGDYGSMAEAVGEAPVTGVTFYPGDDFDPADSFSVDSVWLATWHDRAGRDD